MSITQNFVFVSVALLIIFNRLEEAGCTSGTSGKKDTELTGEKHGQVNSHGRTETGNRNGMDADMDTDDDSHPAESNIVQKDGGSGSFVVQSQYTKIGLATDMDDDDETYEDIQEYILTCRDSLDKMGFKGDLDVDCPIIRDIRRYGEYTSERMTELDLLNGTTGGFSHINVELKKLLVDIKQIVDNMYIGVNSNADIIEDIGAQNEKLIEDEKIRFELVMRYVEYVEKVANKCKEAAKPVAIHWMSSHQTVETPMDPPQALTAPFVPVDNLFETFCADDFNLIKNAKLNFED